MPAARHPSVCLRRAAGRIAMPGAHPHTRQSRRGAARHGLRCAARRRRALRPGRRGRRRQGLAGVDARAWLPRLQYAPTCSHRPSSRWAIATSPKRSTVRCPPSLAATTGPSRTRAQGAACRDRATRRWRASLPAKSPTPGRSQTSDRRRSTRCASCSIESARLARAWRIPPPSTPQRRTPKTRARRRAADTRWR